MKVHRLTVIIVDHDELGAKGCVSELENARYANDCIGPRVIQVETADCGEWSDDHPLNRKSTTLAELDRLGWEDVTNQGTSDEHQA